ncbi:MAG: dynamin family protein [Anaerolineae bacterium]|nr:dynamin family protein [Anaerolineae bacterium]
MLRKLLSQEQDTILKEERRQLEGLQVTLARLDAPPGDMLPLQQALRQLEELFLLVVVGEFNAGKSAFINALLGQRLLPEGVTPTTTQIQRLRYGDAPGQAWEGDILTFTYPADWLRDINLVDTPGTNAVIQRHQELTEEFIPRSDLVLFVTSADRPFSESERAFMERIRAWGKKVVVVVNKIDILEGQAEVAKVVDFVDQHARTLLGIAPQIFPVSARLARQAKQTTAEAERQALWSASRFAPLERFILETLDERERIRLKLESPLGVADRLAAQYLDVARHRLTLLKEDFATLDTVEAQLAVYEEDMRRDFRYHLSHVENVLHQMMARGTEFFDETIRLLRIFDLLNAERVRGEFERRVVADTVNQVETHVGELIDWMVEKDFQQWQAVMDTLNQRSTQHEGRMVGRVGGRFEYSRQELLASVGRAAQAAVRSYDKEKEARQLAESIQTAVAQTALLQVGAIGLGAILVKLLATALADVTGVLAASVVAALGLYIIPARRRRAKKELQQKVNDLRERLSAALTQQFEEELARSLRRIREAMAPYTRFVRGEHEQLQRIEQELLATQNTLRSLRARVQHL